MTWTPALSRTLTELLKTNQPFADVVVVEAIGSAPQGVGARMIVLDDDTIHGTVGGGRFEWEVMRAAREALAEGSPRLVRYDLGKDLNMGCGGTMAAFIEPHMPAERVIIYGAGHCARALAPLLSSAGFRVRVVDPRPELLESAGFEDNVDKVEADPGEDAARSIRTSDRVLVMTHDHAHDLFVLRAALPRKPRLIGVMASRRKALKFRNTLAGEGFAQEDLDAVHMPVGLDIGAVGPEEIAVSITAQLIRIRRGTDDEA